MESCVEECWRMPDVLWERMELLLPKYRRSRKGGRPRLSMRDVADGIFYVLRTGCQWKAAPRAFGSGSSLHHYFQQWTKRGVFRQLWHMSLLEYDDLKGIQWDFQSIDGAMTKAPLGGEKNRSKSDRSSEVGRETIGLDRRRGRPARRRRRRGKYARQAAA